MAKPNLKPQVPGQPAAVAAAGSAAPVSTSIPEAQAQISEPLQPTVGEGSQATSGDVQTGNGDTPPAEALAPAPAAAPQPEQQPEVTQVPGQPGELPDQSEIDPTKITRTVLTKQGYICPAPAPTKI